MGGVPGQVHRHPRGRLPPRDREVRVDERRRSEPTLAEVCVVACAEAWRGDGEILASPIGTIPTHRRAPRRAHLRARPRLHRRRRARSSAAPLPAGAAADVPRSRSRRGCRSASMFDIVWSGRRHVMMGATQVDRFGNQNIACIGPWAKPKAQLLGVRGAPGNTVNHPTSYWVPQHGPRVVRRAGRLRRRASATTAPRPPGPTATRVPRDPPRRLEPRACSTSRRPTTRCASARVHPGVTVDDVVESHRLRARRARRRSRRRALPTDEELRLIREVLDPDGARGRDRRGPAGRMTHPALHTRALRSVRGRLPDRADGHGLGRRARGSRRPRPTPAGSASSPPRR